MRTTQRISILVIVIVCAAAAIYEGYQAAQVRKQVRALQQERAALAEQIQQLQKERDDSANRLATMSGEIARSSTNNLELMKLRGELARLRATEPPNVSKPQMSASEASAAAAFDQMVRKTKESTSEFALEGLLLQMKQRLNLTPDQEAAIRDLFKGEPVPRSDKHQAALEALLTPDQQAAYKQFKQDTQSDKERLRIHQAVLDVLVNLQSNVGLNQEQQDNALTALLEYGQHKVMYDGSQNQSPDASAIIAAERDLTRLILNAMKGVLTSEQMAVFQKYEEEMLEVKTFVLPSEPK